MSPHSPAGASARGALSRDVRATGFDRMRPIGTGACNDFGYEALSDSQRRRVRRRPAAVRDRGRGPGVGAHASAGGNPGMDPGGAGRGRLGEAGELRADLTAADRAARGVDSALLTLRPRQHESRLCRIGRIEFQRGVFRSAREERADDAHRDRGAEGQNGTFGFVRHTPNVSLSRVLRWVRRAVVRLRQRSPAVTSVREQSPDNGEHLAGPQVRANKMISGCRSAVADSNRPSLPGGC